MAKFLFTCHDAGGTVPPVVAVAEALISRGHDVSILSQPSVEVRARAVGAGFFAFSELADYDRRQALEEQLALTVPMVSGPSVGHDLLAVADETGADVFVVDPNLSGALAAAESTGRPSAVLLHSMYKTFVDTWFADIWLLLGAAINATRTSFGVDPVDSWSASFDAHDLILSPVPAAFDAPVDGRVAPSTIRPVGFAVPDGSGGDRDVFPPGEQPAVLVGLSTTYQAQEPLFQAIIDAIASAGARGLVTTAGHVKIDDLRVPPQVTVAEYVPHAALLPDADAMITHAGLGSVAAALHVGVPLVCAPINRDQPLNAERVEALNAGVTVSGHPSTDELAAALDCVLTDESLRAGAASLAAASRAHGGPLAAASELESLSG